MKASISLSFILVSIFCFKGKSLANSEESIISSIDNQTITISLLRWKAKNVELKVIDNFGEILIRENLITNEKPVRRYNFRKVPGGYYNIEIEDKQKISIATVLVERNKIKIINENIIFKPMINYSNKAWYLSFLALGEKVTAQIFDIDNQLIFHEEYKNKGSIQRKYNLCNLKEGEYKLRIITGARTYEMEYVRI